MVSLEVTPGVPSHTVNSFEFRIHAALFLSREWLLAKTDNGVTIPK